MRARTPVAAALVLGAIGCGPVVKPVERLPTDMLDAAVIGARDGSVDAGQIDGGTPGDGGVAGNLECGTPAHPNLLANPGFERAPLEGAPTAPGRWVGDDSEIVASEGGVVRRSGQTMVAFRATTSSGPTDATGAQLRQIVLLRPDERNRRVVLCAHFNRVTGGPQTDVAFSVKIWGHQGEPSTLPQQYNDTFVFEVDPGVVWTDGDVRTWEEACASAVITGDPNFLLVEVRAVEDVFPNDTTTEFDGHFADDACLALYEL